MAIASVKVGIKSVTPLIMHRYPLVAIEALEKRPVEEQAEAVAYRMPDSGHLYIPAVALQRALVNAASYSKGKGRASLQKQAAACLLVSPEYLDLGVKDYAIDTRPVVIPATKGRVLRHRPRLDEWSVDFILEWDDVLLKESEVRRIVDDAGTRVGLLDFRPERKGPYGRFMVVNWK